MTCEPAPIAKRSSVALGESEIILAGTAACAGLTLRPNVEITMASAVATLKNFIKKLPQYFEGGSWANDVS
ncbi:unannotated protein [freshwater metagenome]|uniref:Unannotated protein n=1 Tax=freshwater metagenome TaxID=449393 RepID=A0A6J7R2G5_9ZZZZ